MGDAEPQEAAKSIPTAPAATTVHKDLSVVHHLHLM